MTHRDPDLTHPDTLSTSAPLRDELARTQILLGDRAEQLLKTQAALAASQADLTKACRERDSLARRCAVRFEERDVARAEASQMRDERDLARAELASARQELESLRAELGTRSTDPAKEKP